MNKAKNLSLLGNGQQARGNRQQGIGNREYIGKKVFLLAMRCTQKKDVVFLIKKNLKTININL
ncbi:MAG: hypothetical protein F6K48_30905 [Okeania sp. SIO3H1]|uniref:hypothetical protein n=1 Tax=Okeania sp. SIO1I7 TaxID=2607772 RepID=UPI0013CA5292|nr:hypothetical protein [Okeania sp. SIO1I7]NEN93061.1 hypothetical protein [Okeania sp. SIO3H1]NET25328.1 hypothetical protein [Okeania sp. SIO1I7]